MTAIRKPVKRAFVGLAGSPLAKNKKQVAQKSDHTLRVPKSPDRQDPIAFDVWFDAFGQKHGRIDLDCAFQECAFDPHLAGGTRNSPGVDSEKSDRSDGDESQSPKQDLGLGTTARVTTGFLEGAREIKRRRPGAKSWWVFDRQLFREFLQPMFESDRNEAGKRAFVLHHYYYKNMQDEDIWEENSWFASPKKVKQYRQYLVKQGAELFADQKPESTWHGRRVVWRGFRCSDPNCNQCERNEVSVDFSGIASITPLV